MTHARRDAVIDGLQMLKYKKLWQGAKLGNLQNTNPKFFRWDYYERLYVKSFRELSNHKISLPQPSPFREFFHYFVDFFNMNPFKPLLIYSENYKKSR